jgi:hypothetical protein
MQLATPVQIYLNLQDYRNRGQEAAQAIRTVIDESKWYSEPITLLKPLKLLTVSCWN